MWLKSYRQHERRIQNPLQPGRWSWEAHMVPAGGTTIEWEGKTYYADDDGWFDVPVELGEFLRKGAYPGGERFLTRFEAREQQRIGFLADDFTEPKPAVAEPKPKAAIVKKTRTVQK